MPTAAIEASTTVAVTAPVPRASERRTAYRDQAAYRDEAAHRDRDMAATWWQAWRARFGLAEVCGTAAATAGFAAGLGL